MNSENRIIKARAKLMKGNIGMASMLLSLELIEASDRCETMATDGVNIYWNDEFVKTLTDDEIQFLLKLYKLYAVDMFFEEDLHKRFLDKTPDQLQKMMATLSQLNYITRHPNGGFTFSAKLLCQFKKMQLI